MGIWNGTGASSPRIQDLSALLATLPQDTPITAALANGRGPLAAALSQPGGLPGGTVPQLTPAPPPSGPMITNGDTSGFVPLTLPAAAPPGAIRPTGGMNAMSMLQSAPRLRGDPSNMSDGIAPRAPLSIDGPGVGLPNPQDGTAALAANMAMPHLHHGIDWRQLAGIASNVLLSASAAGGNEAAARMLDNQALLQRLRETHRLDQQDRAAEPRVVGDSLVIPDPSSPGGFRAAYTAPDKTQPFEAYAAAQGLQPGTPEYAKAVQDYRLGGWSDAALGNREALSGVNYGYRDALQGERLHQSDINNQRTTGTSAANNIRTTGTSAANNQRSTGVSAANNLRTTGQSNTNNLRSTATQAGSFAYQHGGSGRGQRGFGVAAAPPAVARAIDPKTGHSIIVRNGRWVDEHSGQPVQ